MVEYTTVRIKKSSLDLLNKLKGENGSVANVVEHLIEMIDGCTIEDIIEIKRDAIAIQLEYVTFDGKGNFIAQSVYNITFDELRNCKVGDMFYANSNPADDTYMNDSAEVIFADDRSVLVRVTETVKTDKGFQTIVHMEHVDLF